MKYFIINIHEIEIILCLLSVKISLLLLFSLNLFKGVRGSDGPHGPKGSLVSKILYVHLTDLFQNSVSVLFYLSLHV